jgi:hypothetical protein
MQTLTITADKKLSLIENGEEVFADAPPVAVVQKLMEIACDADPAYAHELEDFQNRITVASGGELRYYDVMITRHTP